MNKAWASLVGVAFATALIALPAHAAGPQTITTLLQVCRFREAMIIQYNQSINRTNLALASERNTMKQEKLANDANALNRLLEAAEQSWQRMDCARLLYSNPSSMYR